MFCVARVRPGAELEPAVLEEHAILRMCKPVFIKKKVGGAERWAWGD